MTVVVRRFEKKNTPYGLGRHVRHDSRSREFAVPTAAVAVLVRQASTGPAGRSCSRSDAPYVYLPAYRWVALAGVASQYLAARHTRTICPDEVWPGFC